MDSGLDASHRPGMTEERILDPDRARWRRSISQEDLDIPGSPSISNRGLCYNKGTMPKQQIMRVLGAAIILIALSFAPSVARAHVGHQHQASVHDGQGQTASQVAAPESERPATPASLQRAQWKQAGTPPASDRNCTGGCCFFACAACCAAGLPSAVAFAPFPRSMTRVAFAPSQIWPDREPESLRRPPKYFI